MPVAVDGTRGGPNSGLTNQSRGASGYEQGQRSTHPVSRGQGTLPGHMYGSVGGMMDQPCITPPQMFDAGSYSVETSSAAEWRRTFESDDSFDSSIYLDTDSVDAKCPGPGGNKTSLVGGQPQISCSLRQPIVVDTHDGGLGGAFF